jgi:hypothetical protein
LLSTDKEITSTLYANDKLTFTVSAPSGTTSTTMVYCGDKGEPTTIQATNGTLTWSYNASTRILTLNVTHVDPAETVVNWRMLGDVNGDGEVDVLDLAALDKAYGSSRSKPNWNPDCDFTGEGAVDISDLFILGKNYGKTKP